ncbi:hypothetical protein GSY74_10440 [Sulfurovum sp. bin170]|uniref:hypothetical protein n=1 Tax=Sulfurovum sp. bin170 TaxID=2695268 RepID=UPI0013DEC256|nr:hypothetical protein [Sulfurovum sp. bin170]NEW61704.1 hypothetical protein [Sulfurovum sp. bin170]
MQTIQFKIDNTYLNFVETLLNSLTIGIKDLSKIDEETKYNDNYFKSKEDEYIFYLLELNGEMQQKKLNIERILYKDRTKATKWRDDIIQIIDPDKSSHPKVTQSAKVLNKIYEEMIKNAK